MHRQAVRSLSLILLLALAAPSEAQRIRELLRERLRARAGGDRPAAGPAWPVESTLMAGRTVYVWRPAGPGPHPLVVFSHGFHGTGVQSRFLTGALAAAGYLVLAPDHADSIRGMLTGGARMAPDEGLARAASWTHATHRDRAQDVRGILAALRAGAAWKGQVDWDRVALAGHSLGGYTVLGLAGAWPSWKLPGIKAVLALSPYANPFAHQRTLSGLRVPVMYQDGTRDLGVSPFVNRPGGAYDQTPGPAYLVYLEDVGHFSFSDLQPGGHEAIVQYARAFLDRYVKGDPGADPARRRPGVAELRVK